MRKVNHKELLIESHIDIRTECVIMTLARGMLSLMAFEIQKSYQYLKFIYCNLILLYSSILLYLSIKKQLNFYDINQKLKR